jgi:hypothetical protein
MPYLIGCGAPHPSTQQTSAGPGGPSSAFVDRIAVSDLPSFCADAFSDFTLARQGYPRMAFSACFGGIIFNILCGRPWASALEASVCSGHPFGMT